MVRFKLKKYILTVMKSQSITGKTQNQCKQVKMLRYRENPGLAENSRLTKVRNG